MNSIQLLWFNYWCVRFTLCRLHINCSTTKKNCTRNEESWRQKMSSRKKKENISNIVIRFECINNIEMKCFGLFCVDVKKKKWIKIEIKCHLRFVCLCVVISFCFAWSEWVRDRETRQWIESILVLFLHAPHEMRSPTDQKHQQKHHDQMRPVNLSDGRFRSDFLVFFCFFLIKMKSHKRPDQNNDEF